MSRLAIFVVLALFCASAFASSCISMPATAGSGAACGGAVNCKQGLYCNREGVCTSAIKAGQPCDDLFGQSQCEAGTRCKGPINLKTCVANASPGESCDNSDSTSLAYCPLSCTNNVCRGGNHGDACTQNTDCATTLNCTANVCTGSAVGEVCINTQCRPHLYCDTTVSYPNWVCREKKTTGACDSSSECAYGYTCIGLSNSDSEQCVQLESREAGQYCGNDDRLCKGSLRCYNNYCASKSVSVCTSGSQCAADESCTCDGIVLDEGYGKCTRSPCYSKGVKASDCLNEAQCTSSSLTYAKSCANLNCAKEVQSSIDCSSGVQLVASLLLVSLLALFASFSSF